MGSRKKQQLLNIKIPQNKNKLQNYTHIANIIDNVYLSDYNTAQDIQVLTLFKITHVINCSPQNCINNFENKIQYLNVEILDEWEANLIENIDAIFKFIQKSQRQNGRILIHCYRGISRSPSVAIAYIIKNLNINENQALKYCKSRYQQAEPNASFMIQLQQYYKQQQDNQKLIQLQQQQQQQQQQQFLEIQKPNHLNCQEIQQLDQQQQQLCNAQSNLIKVPFDQQENQFYKSSPFNLLHFQQNKSLFQNVDQSLLILLQHSTQSTSDVALQQNSQESILNGWSVSKNSQDYQINQNKVQIQTNDFRISKNEDQINNNDNIQINKYPELIISQGEQLPRQENQNLINIFQNQPINKPINFSKNHNHINYVKGKTQIEQLSDQNLDKIQTHWDNLSYHNQSLMDKNYRHTFSVSCQDYSQLALNSNETNESKFLWHSYHGDISQMNSYLIQAQYNPTHSQPPQQNIDEEVNITKQDLQNQVETKKNDILIHSNEELDSNCSIYAQSDKFSKQSKIISENQTQNNQNGFQSDSFASEKSYIESNSLNQQRELRNSNQSNMSTTNNNETSFCSINHEKKYYNDYFYDDEDEILFGTWPQKKIRLEQH
ncbi:hypothetical protein ABPG72_014995 [Tetrahymena utriculariae]